MKAIHPISAAALIALALWAVLVALHLAGPGHDFVLNGKGGPANTAGMAANTGAASGSSDSDAISAPATKDEQLLNPNMYQGPFKETWIRVRAVQEDLATGKEPPGQLNLVFQTRKGNFLYFYDMTGRAVKVRYRESKFDTDAIDQYKTLIKGHAYKVSMAFEGVEVGGGKFYKYTGMADMNDEFKKAALDVEAVLVFRIFDFQVLRLETIRF